MKKMLFKAFMGAIFSLCVGISIILSVSFAKIGFFLTHLSVSKITSQFGFEF